MNEGCPDFFKFPTTPHLTILGTGKVREDKVLTQLERDYFLEHKLTVEEKIDGANLGISFDSTQLKPTGPARVSPLTN